MTRESKIILVYQAIVAELKPGLMQNGAGKLYPAERQKEYLQNRISWHVGTLNMIEQTVDEQILKEESGNG